MNSLLKKIFHNYTYLFNTDFHINKKQYLILTILILLLIVSSFSIIYFTMPFLDILFSKNYNDYHSSTKFLFNLYKNLNLDPSLTLCGLVFLFAMILKALLEIVYELYGTKLRYIYMKEEGVLLNQKIFNMDLSFFYSFSSSKMLSLLKNELERSSNLFTIFYTSINALCQLTIFIGIPLYLNTKLTLTFFLILSIMLIPLLFLNYLTLKEGRITTVVDTELMKTFNNILNNFKILLIHGLVENVNNYFRKSFTLFAKNKIKLVTFSSIGRNYLQPIAILSVLLTVSLLDDTLKNLSTFGVVIWSLTRAMPAINTILSGFREINAEIPALKNLYDIKNSYDDLQNKNGNNAIKTIKEISFKNIKFNFGEKEIYKDLNFKINKGEKVALVGDTGTGKSTFLDILSIFLKINSGSRLINNIDYKDIDFVNLRKLVSYVPQSINLIDSNVKEFFYYFNNKEIEENKINYFLDIMGCGSFLGTKPDRIGIYLGDKGMKISGGQKQKIVLAAALSREPELLILDESTNALDLITEKSILQKITDYKNLTLIFISHKLPKDKIFDKIYKVENNNLVLL